MEQRLFISYHATDAAFVEQLTIALQHNGLLVERSDGSKHRPLLRSSVRRDIERSAIFVVVLSPDALQARTVEDACRLAVYHPDTVRTLVPVIARSVARADLWPFLVERVPALATGPDHLPGEDVTAATQHIQTQMQYDRLPPTLSRALESNAAEFRANADDLPQAPIPTAKRAYFTQDEASRPHIYICFQPDETLAAEAVFDDLHHSYSTAEIIRDQSRRISDAEFQAYVLDRLIQHCEVFVVLIGPDSLKHMDNPNDRFRKQIAFALNAPHIKVIPVLDGVRLRKKRLPLDLQPLAAMKGKRRAIDIAKDTNYERTFRGINQIMKRGVFREGADLLRNVIYGLIGAAVLSGLVVAYQHVFPSPAPPPLASVHTSTAVMLLPNTPAQTVVANCPSGSTALSGGYSIMDAASPNRDYFAQASYPSTTTTSAGATISGWTVTYMNDSNDQQTFQASVMCVANAMPAAQIVAGTIDATGQGMAMCPKGMQATGGGYSFNDAAVTASIAAPVNPQEGAAPTGWMVQTNGAQLGDQQSVYAVCVSGLRHIVLGSPTTISVNEGNAASVQAACAAGSLIGSGYRLNEQDGVQNVYIIRNAPLPSATGWQMTLSNLDGTNQGGKLWPICQG